MRALVTKLLRRYPDRVSIARRPERRIEPLRRPSALDAYEGKWVAVNDDRVIASADTSSELARTLRSMGPAAHGVVMQFVRPAADGYIVGVG